MRRHIASMVREDKSDPFACSMNAWFLVAGVLYDRGEDIPQHWQYKPGLGPLADFDSYDIEEVQATPTEELIHAGNVLERYTRFLDKAGRSY